MSSLPRKKRLVVAVASGIAGTTLLSGCAEEQVDASIFADIPACVASGQDQLACEEAFSAARKQHADLAPQFASAADCEAEFGAGNCGDASRAEVSEGGGGSFFFPLLAGYMMGSALANRGQPLYRSKDGNWRNPAGQNLGSRTGPTSVPKSATATPTSRTRVTSRGGFSSPRASSGSGG